MWAGPRPGATLKLNQACTNYKKNIYEKLEEIFTINPNTEMIIKCVNALCLLY